MPETLHIYLNSDDAEFNFARSDFSEFTTAHPSICLQFLESEAELLETLPTITALDTWYFDQNWFDLAPKLRHLFTPAAGRENVARDESQKIKTHYGTFHGTMMAESALALILQFSLRLLQYRSQQQNHIWQRIPARLIRNQTALIIGYGHIGRQTGALLSGLGMTVWGHQRQPKDLMDGAVTLIPQSQLHDYLPRADHVISFLPGDDTTRHFISEEFISRMSPNAFLYNFGRGSTIDEEALLAALQQRNLAGAGLDVTETEPLPTNSGLWDEPNAILVPHASSYFEEYRSLHVAELTELARNLLNLQI
ncbi:MAG: D-2-hydroxyacid dehydrogenase (NADP+) [Patiriisocius sp.]|jgi:D-2-hydroxyacid dehydrogenase (NADP+)